MKKKQSVAKKIKKKIFQINVELIAYDKMSLKKSKTAGMFLGGTWSKTVKTFLPRKPNNSLYYCI